ncbi:hypothetical protein BaRGS_00003257, partial [Batillaria attramentaria]
MVIVLILAHFTGNSSDCEISIVAVVKVAGLVKRVNHERLFAQEALGEKACVGQAASLLRLLAGQHAPRGRPTAPGHGRKATLLRHRKQRKKSGNGEHRATRQKTARTTHKKLCVLVLTRCRRNATKNSEKLAALFTVSVLSKRIHRAGHRIGFHPLRDK